MKRIIAILFLASLSAFGQQTNRTPLNRAFLQSDLDGNGKQATNFGTIKATNFINAASGLPIGSSPNALTNHQSTVANFDNDVEVEVSHTITAGAIVAGSLGQFLVDTGGNISGQQILLPGFLSAASGSGNIGVTKWNTAGVFTVLDLVNGTNANASTVFGSGTVPTARLPALGTAYPQALTNAAAFDASGAALNATQGLAAIYGTAAKSNASAFQPASVTLSNLTANQFTTNPAGAALPQAIVVSNNVTVDAAHQIIGAHAGSGAAETNLFDVSNAFNGGYTNPLNRTAHGFSVNAVNTVFLQKALNNGATHKLKILWLGDSTGFDSIGAFSSLFSSYYLYGLEPDLINFGPSVSYFDSSAAGVSNVPYGTFNTFGWWGAAFGITNGTATTFGIRNSTPIPGDRLQLWYCSSNIWGTLSAFTSPSSASNTWTLRATVDTTTGPNGLRMTNIAMPFGSYYVKISNSVPGTESRSFLVWAHIESSQTTAATFFDGHGTGETVDQFLAMGTNSIACLFTNFAPDVIIYQQTKPVAGLSSLATFRNLVKTYATNTDIVLISSQEANDPAIAIDPANGGQFQLPIVRQIAISNDWTYIDNRTPFSSWTNIIIPAGFSDNTVSGVHFDTLGTKISGQVVLQQLGMVDKLTAANVFVPTVGATTNGFDPGQVPNLTFRYDPATSTVSGINFTSFKDYSGNGYDALAAGSGGPYTSNSTAQIGGRTWASFQGSQSLAMNQPTHISQPSTVYLVAKYTDVGGNYIFDSTNSTTSQRNLLIDNDMFSGTDMAYSTETGVWKIFKLVFNGNSSSLSTNGLFLTNGAAGSSTLDGLTIGARFNGANKGNFGLAYFLWYNASLTAAQDYLVTDWLNKRFSIYATPIGSFSSLALSTALTDETGSGSAVFGTSPTFNGTVTIDNLAMTNGAAFWTGKTNIGNLATSLVISIGHTMANTNYSPSVSVLGAALTGISPSYSGLTTTQFQLNLGTGIAGGDNLTWSVIYSP